MEVRERHDTLQMEAFNNLVLGKRRVELKLETVREALDFMYDAWIDSDIHSRHGYEVDGCFECDAVSDMYEIIEQEVFNDV